MWPKLSLKYFVLISALFTIAYAVMFIVDYNNIIRVVLAGLLAFLIAIVTIDLSIIEINVGQSVK